MSSSTSTINGLHQRPDGHGRGRLHHADVHPKPGQDLISDLIGYYRRALSPLFSPFFLIFRFVYIVIQRLLVLFFKPNSPPEHIRHPYGRIAVIGAGLTGISSASHAISHGFEVVIYEATDRPGGIWSRTNKASGLQSNSLFYRFHPAVVWREAFPKRDEIIGEIDKIWKEYRLQERTRLNTPVTKVTRLPHNSGDNSQGILESSKWLINGGEDGPFDALIVTIGTCGDPMWPPFEGMPRDAGKVGIEVGRIEHDRTNGPIYEHQHGEEELSKSAKKRRNKAHSKKEKQAREAGSRSPGEEGSYGGLVLHSCQLDDATPELLGEKTVLVIGSDASAIEAVETALERGARSTVILAGGFKWIIPRNIIFDTFLAAQPFGREMPLSFLWERVLKHWHYRGVEDLVPDQGIFVGTPIVNDEFLNHVRSERCTYVRGDVLRLTPTAVRVAIHEKVGEGSTLHKQDAQDVNGEYQHGAEANGNGKEKVGGGSHIEDIQADVVILATGYKRPDMSFLPRELFPEGYDRSNLYLQNFSTEDWSVLMTNSAYPNAIGTVGHFHIGIYTRILLMLLLDPSTRPSPKDMKFWVDKVGSIKRGASGGAFSLFTYTELVFWLFAFNAVRPDRLLWMPFIMQGWGVRPDDR